MGNAFNDFYNGDDDSEGYMSGDQNIYVGVSRL